MGIKKTVKKGITAGWSPTRWAGTDHLKENASVIKNLARSIFRRNKGEDAGRVESFEQALQRLGMSEQDLQKRMNNSKIIVAFAGSLAFLVFLYMFYMFLHHSVLSGIVCLVLTIVLLSYAVREHFNLFQMRQRRLGCTLKEWFNYTVKGSKK